MNVNSKIRVLSVDEHPIVCEGLGSLFDKQSDIELVGQAHSWHEAIKLSEELAPDVAVIDINLPGMDSIEAIVQLKKLDSSIGIVIFSALLHNHIIKQTLKNGVSGLLFKKSTPEEVLSAIYDVHKGDVYMCSRTRNIVINDRINQLKNPTKTGRPVITEREYEVIRLLSDGKSTKEIARLIHISPKTVDAGRRQIMDKLKMSSFAELVKFAIREGITSN